jgi:hypothetical protein
MKFIEAEENVDTLSDKRKLRFKEFSVRIISGAEEMSGLTPGIVVGVVGAG